MPADARVAPCPGWRVSSTCTRAPTARELMRDGAADDAGADDDD